MFFPSRRRRRNPLLKPLLQNCRQGKSAEAQRDYRIIEAYPCVPEAYTNLGLCYFLQKKYREAADTFQRGLKLQPDMANAWLFLGISLFDLNDPARAVVPLRRYTSSRRDDAEGHYYLGISLLSLENFGDAVRELLEARRTDPRNTDTLYHLAQCYLHLAQSKRADVKSLRTAFERTAGEIAAIDPASVRLRQLQAGFYEADGDSDEAIRELEEAVKSHPHVQGLYYTLGCLYLKEYRHDQALAQFNSELALDSPYPRTYLQIGHAYTDRHQPEKAIPFLEKATHADPESGKPWVEMGRAYLMTDQFDRAASALEKAIKLGNKTASTYFIVSTAYRRMGKLDLAQQAVKHSEQASREQSDRAVEHARTVAAKQNTK